MAKPDFKSQSTPPSDAIKKIHVADDDAFGALFAFTNFGMCRRPINLNSSSQTVSQNPGSAWISTILKVLQPLSILERLDRWLLC